MNRNQSIQYLSWLLIALLVAPATLFAGNKDENDIPWYQIELIIFLNQNQQGIVSETWPEPSEIIGTSFNELSHADDASALAANRLQSASGSKSKLPNFASTTPGMPTPFELLSKTELQLTPVANKLRNSRNYKPLLHIGWRQPTLHPDDSKPIFVFQGVDLPLISDAANLMQETTASDGANRSAGGNRFSSVAVGSFTLDSSQYGQLMPPSQVDLHTGPQLNPFYGTLRLSVSRYLHLEANLNYRIPVIKEELVPVNMEDAFVSSRFQQNMAFTEQGEAAEMRMQSRETLQNFNMFETRRMRSKEIHYFDHPLLGIVVRVIPYEIVVKEPDFDPASQAFTSGTSENPSVKSPQ